MNVSQYIEQVIKYSQTHPYLSLAIFSLVWVYAVTKTFKAFAEADEKLVLMQKHVVDTLLSLDKAAGIDPIPSSEMQSIIFQAGQIQVGYTVLLILGILAPITFFAFLTSPLWLSSLVVLFSLGIIAWTIFRLRSRNKMLTIMRNAVRNSAENV